MSGFDSRRPELNDAPTSTTRTIGSRGAGGVAIASVVSAGTSFAISLVVARLLPPDETASFLVYWGLLFAVYGVLSGLQSEATRAVRTAAVMLRAGRKVTGARVLPVALGIGAMVALLLGVSSPLWSERILGPVTPEILLVVCASAFAYSGHAAFAGATAGRQLWGLYAWLMGTESSVRLFAVLCAVLLGGSLFGLETACAAAAVVWLAFLFSRRAREAAGARADVAAPRLIARYGYAMGSAAASALLITGFPLLFTFTSPPATVAASAGLLLAVQITRAPIMIPLQAFQGVAIASFVNQRDHAIRALLKPVMVLAGISLLGAGLAWLLGPWVMLVFGPGYSVPGWVLAALTLGAGALAVLTLTGAAALAVGRHRSYLLGWVAATLVSGALLLIPFVTEIRVPVALLVGPLVGAAVHVLGVAGNARHESQGAME